MLEDWFKNKEGPQPGSSRPGSVLRKKKKSKKKGSQSSDTRQSQEIVRNSIVVDTTKI